MRPAGSCARRSVRTRSAQAGQWCTGRRRRSSCVPPPRTPHGSLPIAELVHRVRPENVLVGAVRGDGEQLTGRAQWPPSGHSLGGRVLEQMVEAARQFATLIGHVGHGKPIDSKYVLRSLEADLPLVLPPGEVCMEWLPVPGDGRTFDLRVRLYRSTDEGVTEEVGTVAFNALIVTPREYQAIRFRQQNGKERAV